MTQKDKELYKRVKEKNFRNFLRILKRVFSEHHESLKSRPQKEQNTIGDFITVLEMDVKRELKNKL